MSRLKGQSPTCSRCHHKGHRSIDCKTAADEFLPDLNPREAKRRTAAHERYLSYRICLGCGQRGHIHSACPTTRYVRALAPKHCAVCGVAGHYASTCTFDTVREAREFAEKRDALVEDIEQDERTGSTADMTQHERISEWWSSMLQQIDPEHGLSVSYQSRPPDIGYDSGLRTSLSVDTPVWSISEMCDYIGVA